MTDTKESTPAQAAVAENKTTENFEAKFKEMQSKYEQKDIELKRVQETLNAVTPYVNWDAANNPPVEEDGYVSKKDIATQLRSISESSENKILELQFQVNHPELKGYENTLVAPTLIKIRRQHPTMSKEELLETTAKEVNEFLETERKRGEQRVLNEKKKKEAEMMSGLETSGQTTPKVDEGETRDEYIANRRKSLNVKRKLV